MLLHILIFHTPITNQRQKCKTPMNYKTVAQNPLSFFMTRTELFGSESLEHVNNQHDRTSNNFKSSKLQFDLAVSECEKISCPKPCSTHYPFYDCFP